jgi:glycosyltransferase involved in cell wall biosynthesis
MISVVMPYWRRSTILAENLARYRDLYYDWDLEIIIVDDGSPTPAKIMGEFPWNVRIIRLADKQIPLNPCVPINVGVRASSGSVVVLTNPEVIHRSPIFGGMLLELDWLGPRGYVAAACWDSLKQRWYCHSSKMPSAASLGRCKTPRGAGFHFCAMLNRSMYDEVGGFSDEYRKGQAYEDADFLWKLHKVGAKFRIADDLITDHRKTASCKWLPGGAARNRKIFEERWGHG